jgi:cytidyltransferase-like protein
MKVAIFIGRFQPLHAGHLKAMETALAENDKLVICIGSAQKEDPLSLVHRNVRLMQQIFILHNDRREDVEITAAEDSEPITNWVDTFVRDMHLDNKIWTPTNKGATYEYTLYRADPFLAPGDEERFKKYGIQTKFLERKPFFYLAPNKLYYKVSSATEIRNLHEYIGIPLT